MSRALKRIYIRLIFVFLFVLSSRSSLQVETMSVELEAKKITVAQAQKDCEELLVEIVSERRVADEQKKQASWHPWPVVEIDGTFGRG